MRIYFAGIGGVGIGPLAAIAKEAGYDVSGYDQSASPMTEELAEKDIPVSIGSGLSEITAAQQQKPIDWLVVTSALPPNDPVLQLAKDNNIRISKRDELINQLVHDKRQFLIAISGTHGKTTITAMLTWLYQQFDIPESHSIGTLVSFAPSGKFSDDGQSFIYEADEYDRNMLQFHPDISLITALDYDHPDTYPTPDDYKQAFRQFIQQSKKVFMWQKDADYLGLRPDRKIMIVDDMLTQESAVTLPGAHNRRNALLACAVFDSTFPELTLEQIIAAINEFPGTQRRFERLAENIYSDYAHHPTEIVATMQLAGELSHKVVVIYQPHQNVRQYDVAGLYGKCFDGAKHVYWLPTFLTREQPDLEVLTPQQLIAKLDNPQIAEPAELNDQLVTTVKDELSHDALVIFMGAGDIDKWARQHLREMVD